MHMRQVFGIGAMILGSLSFIGCVDSTNEPEMTYSTDAIKSPDVPASNPQRLAGSGCTQQVWTGTLFYADAAETQLIGECSITCSQWVQGVASPEPGEGGSCQGTTSGFQAVVISTCTGCRF